MRTKPTRPIRRTGFTLIEILVVVAIIALLIAILLPSLRNAKEMSKAAVCGTQMQQIFNGALMYSQGNKDRLPYFGGYWSFSAAEPQWWPTQISRLVGNNFGLYKCPSDKLPYQVPVRWVNGTLKMALNTTGTTQLAMTYRGSCDSLEDQNGKYLSRKITSWRYPGRNILLVEAEAQDLRMDPNALHECFRLSDNLKCLDDSDPRYVANWKAPYFQEWKRHVGRTNILFLDGHVDRLTPRQASKLGKWQEHYLVPPT